MTNTTGEGRFVSVTSAQRRAAAALVERSKTTGKKLSPSVEKIANAKTIKGPDGLISERHTYGPAHVAVRSFGTKHDPGSDEPAAPAGRKRLAKRRAD